MSKVGDCRRCGAPQGMIGWLCGHNGDYEHDMNEDNYWEDWNKRMNNPAFPKEKEKK